jgi:hypothetical protein
VVHLNLKMRILGHSVELLRAGTDYEDWRLGVQLAIDGRVATMFDLHKSKIHEVGDGSPAYEELLYRSASSLLLQNGPQRPGVPAASPH